MEGLQFAETAGGGMTMVGLFCLSRVFGVSSRAPFFALVCLDVLPFTEFISPSQVGRFVPSGGSGRGGFLSGGDQRDQALQKGMSNIQFVAGACASSQPVAAWIFLKKLGE